MSSLPFRNVDVSPEAPVVDWPQEAIQTSLERGSLTHWRRLGEAIQDDPWGPVARRIEEVLSYSRPYGVARAFERLIAGARAKAEAADRAAVVEEITRLVRESGLSGAEFASLVGTSASRLSTYVNGRVVPSAAMLVRMRRAAAAQRRL